MIALRISEAAALSIIEQGDYYQQASDRALAARWETAVDQAVHSLLSQPERGALVRFRSPILTELRWIPIPGFPKHMLFYRYLPQEQAVLIVQVLHGARKLEVILNDDSEV